MIFVPILIILYGLLYGLVALMPTGGLPDGIVSGFQSIMGYVFAVNNFLPIDTFLTILKYSVYLDGIMLIIWFFLFIINYARGR